MNGLDDPDRRLLGALRHQGWITNRTLAKRVGLSERACFARLKRLERAGFIVGYAAILSVLTGASRSGKGRGHVAPTLLATPRSALVVDVKGELADGDPRHAFPGTAGFRETLGLVLRFAPTRAQSIRFNPRT